MSTENPNDKLGALLRKLLKERNLSMRQLGTLTNIDPSTISRIISGKQQAKQKHLQKFAECLKSPTTTVIWCPAFSFFPYQKKKKSICITPLIRFKIPYSHRTFLIMITQQYASNKNWKTMNGMRKRQKDKCVFMKASQQN